MPRKQKKTKPLICVFCEGESEVAYANFLRDKFQENVIIKSKMVTPTAIFAETERLFQKDPKYRNKINSIDEIWFFFDVEDYNLQTVGNQNQNVSKWHERLVIINSLRGLRKNPALKVRLLMTSGGIEYWFLLHFEMTAPPCKTTADKANIISDLQSKWVPEYKKGKTTSIKQIAERYSTAVQNSSKILNLLSTSKGLPKLTVDSTIRDEDERNQWLCTHCETFSTVHEAISFLRKKA